MPAAPLHEDAQIESARAEATRIAREWAEANEGQDAPHEPLSECVVTHCVITAEGAQRVQKGSRAMNAILTRNEIQPSRCQLRAATITNAEAREMALSRLLNLLEGEAAGYTHQHTDNTLECGVELSQLARLRAARASYALATNSNMRRVGRGAWMRE